MQANASRASFHQEAGWMSSARTCGLSCQAVVGRMPLNRWPPASMMSLQHFLACSAQEEIGRADDAFAQPRSGLRVLDRL